VPKFLSGPKYRDLIGAYNEARHGVIIRHTTWQQVGDALWALTGLELNNPLSAPLQRMIEGFLVDLKQRQLWGSFP
jgi:hypothetical protein